MTLEAYFPVWDQLTPAQQSRLSQAAVVRTVPAGTLLHGGASDCIGLLLIESGQLRAYILSDEGREVTLYRLFSRDICLFSASCMMQSIQFDVTVSAEKDSVIRIVPPDVYKALMQECAAVANYTNELMATRFSEVMWRIEQILWKRLDARLAAFLLQECALEDSDTLRLTHDQIAAHLGTAREVVSRMLGYFRAEGMVTLSRGTVTLADRAGLAALSDA